MRKILLLALLPFLLCGCSKRVYVPVERTMIRSDTLHVERMRRDTLIQRDSIVICQRGDTVLKEVWRERASVAADLRYRNRVVHDTVVKIELREVAVDGKTSDKAPSFRQRFKDAVENVFWTIGVLIIIICIWKLKKS